MKMSLGLHSKRPSPRKRFQALPHRKKVAVMIAAGISVLMIGGASAAWMLSATGTTTSTESTCTTGCTSPVTVTATDNTDNLLPGGPAGIVAIDITNPSANVGVQVKNVVVAVTGTDAPGCDPSNFIVTQPGSFADATGTAQTMPFTIPPNGNVYSGTGWTTDAATVAIIASAADACQGATIQLSETVS